MSFTVGLQGANGNIGKPTAEHLIQAANAQKIKLVIFHRAESKIDALKAAATRNVEFRVLDMDAPADQIQKVVQGVNVFVNTVNGSALGSEPKLVEALKAAGDCVRFIPSTFTIPWTKADAESPVFGEVVAHMYGGLWAAQKAGLAVTKIYAGAFDNYFMGMPLFGFDIKANEAQLNTQQMQNQFPITYAAHLGFALAKLATQDPKTLADQYRVITYTPTGQEIVDLYTRVNGQPPEVTSYTPAAREQRLAVPHGAIFVGYLDKWAHDSFDFDTYAGASVEGYAAPSLEEVARSYARAA